MLLVAQAASAQAQRPAGPPGAPPPPEATDRPADEAATAPEEPTPGAAELEGADGAPLGARGSDEGTAPTTTTGATRLRGADEPHGPVVQAALGRGFQLASADGRQSLRLAGLFSARMGVRPVEGADPNWFAAARLGRIAITGNLAGHELTYYFQGEFAGAPQLLDLELTWNPVEELRLRFGRIRVPLGRQWITGLGALMLPDRASVSDLFRPGRDTGITLESYLFDGKIEMRAGAYAESGDRWPRAVARLAFSPLGAVPYSEDIHVAPGPVLFQLGVNGAYDKLVPVVDGPNAERMTGGVDVAFRAGPFAAFAESYVERRHIEEWTDMALPERTALAAGAFAQAGVFVVPSHLQIYGRFDMYAQDIRNTGNDGLRRYEAGLGGYLFESAVKLQARYAFDDAVGAAPAEAPPLGVIPPPQGHVADVQFVLSL